MSRLYVERLNEALLEMMEEDPRVYVLGEDILDPYGGAFKVTRGLSSAFPQRVIGTPISEAGIIGFAGGLALRGLRPIVEIMFGDFVTLGVDQIINHLGKFRAMYNGQVTCPVVIRMPMGGGRGYGPTHSQSLERLFLGIPHLTVVAPSHFHDPGAMLKQAVEHSQEPVIFIEHKLLYPCELQLTSREGLEVRHEGGPYPTAIVRNYEAGDPDVVVVSYGGMSRLVRDLLIQMIPEEIRVIAFLPSDLRNPVSESLQQCVEVTHRVVVVEEGPPRFGWASEVCCTLSETCGGGDLKLLRVGSWPTVIPAARDLENAVLPSVERLESAVMKVLQ